MQEYSDLKFRAYTLMEEALKLLDVTGDHFAGVLLDEAICTLGKRLEIK